jgi:hypothetical protein
MHRRPSVTGLALATTMAVALSACSFDSPTSSSSHLSGSGVDTISAYVPYTGTFEYQSSGSQYQFSGSTEIAVGDIANVDQTDRGIITFNVQPLDGDTATGATLTAYECDVIGNPFTANGGSLGEVIVDHITPGTPPGQTQYAGSTIESDVGPLAPDNATGPRNLTVTSEVQEDIQGGATYSQFRLRFSAEDGNPNGTANYVDFQTANGVDCASDAVEAPKLIVTYN